MERKKSQSVLSTSTKKLPECVLDTIEKESSAGPLDKSKIEKKENRIRRAQTAGPKWYDLPKAKITPEVELDLKLLKMRNFLDPKRHYKKSTMKETPEYFQIGTVVENAADFYSSRIPKKERKNHWIDELVADEELRKYTKRKVEELAKKKSSGNKESYRNKVAKRRKTFT